MTWAKRNSLLFTVPALNSDSKGGSRDGRRDQIATSACRNKRLPVVSPAVHPTYLPTLRSHCTRRPDSDSSDASRLLFPARSKPPVERPTWLRLLKTQNNGKSLELARAAGAKNADTTVASLGVAFTGCLKTALTCSCILRLNKLRKIAGSAHRPSDTIRK